MAPAWPLGSGTGRVPAPGEQPRRDDAVVRIGDGASRFSVYPDELAHNIRDRMLHNERAGEPVLLTRLLPYFEREALARLKHRLRPAAGQPLPRAAELRDYVSVARSLAFDDVAGDVVLWQAAQVVILADDLRSALAASPAVPHRVGALAIALACEAIAGGFDLEYLELQADRDVVAAKHKPFADNKGKHRPGAIKQLVLKVLPALERTLKRKAAALEVWAACAQRKPRGLDFVDRDGRPDHVWSASGATSWERFRVIVSEARRAIPGPG